MARTTGEPRGRHPASFPSTCERRGDGVEFDAIDATHHTPQAAAGLIPFPDALADDAARDALAAAEARWCPRGAGINAGRAREQAGIRHLCDLLPAGALARKALPP